MFGLAFEADAVGMAPGQHAIIAASATVEIGALEQAKHRVDMVLNFFPWIG
jgi:hypothetical protein